MRRVQSSDRVSDRGARTKFVLRLRSNYQILKHKQITECLRNVATFTHIIPQSKSNPAVVYMATRADMKKAYETFKKQYSDKIEVEVENPKYIQEISEPRRQARDRILKCRKNPLTNFRTHNYVLCQKFNMNKNGFLRKKL